MTKWRRFDVAPVVTVTPTIGDGVAVRWYRTERAAEDAEPVVSASRNGVTVRFEVRPVMMHTLAELAALVTYAAEIADRLVRTQDGYDGLATHKRPLGTWRVEPVGA